MSATSLVNSFAAMNSLYLFYSPNLFFKILYLAVRTHFNVPISNYLGIVAKNIFLFRSNPSERVSGLKDYNTIFRWLVSKLELFFLKSAIMSERVISERKFS